MISTLKRKYADLIGLDPELHKVLDFIQRYTGATGEVCDVGCGYGRFLKPLTEHGFRATGIDKNLDTVAKLQQENLHCVSDSEFYASQNKFDTILMSHIVEHFAPDDLLPFMEGYLNRLKQGGHLVIATPLYSEYFYDCFDHVKPYHPISFQVVFNKNKEMIQYQAKNKLELVDLWFRRSPIVPRHNRGAYLNGLTKRLHQIGYGLGYLAFIATFGLMSTKDGWVGVFKKVSE